MRRPSPGRCARTPERAEHSDRPPDYAAPTMAGRRGLCAGAVGLALAMGPVVASTGGSAQAALQPGDLTVMTFNIWYGATVTHGLDEVVRAIREAGGDVGGAPGPNAATRTSGKAVSRH